MHPFERYRGVLDWTKCGTMKCEMYWMLENLQSQPVITKSPGRIICCSFRTEYDSYDKVCTRKFGLTQVAMVQLWTGTSAYTRKGRRREKCVNGFFGISKVQLKLISFVINSMQQIRNSRYFMSLTRQNLSFNFAGLLLRLWRPQNKCN